MARRKIKKVAVLGSGIMGSRIACHFAGIGVQVLLLDIISNEAKESTNKQQRNKLVNDALQAAIKSNPSPLYTLDAAKKITTGNFDDNLKDIVSCDWIIEVVVEKLDIKRSLY
jgi:3-hydroxyacyl-CoA dehydrogenase